ncbi:MAG: CopG family transcriptional regulator [Thermoprotei archaeon]|nr:MAG: CopG family transcriptional regulator [Thermoprotei archaeon]
MRVVSFKVEEELLELLDIYARQRGKSRSEVIREAIIALLQNEIGTSRPIYRSDLKVKKLRVL